MIVGSLMQEHQRLAKRAIAACRRGKQSPLIWKQQTTDRAKSSEGWSKWRGIKTQTREVQRQHIRNNTEI